MFPYVLITLILQKSSFMTIKAIIFDMDGVLIDAKDWHYEALNEALSMFGMIISRYDHLVTFDGLPTREKLKMISLERGLPVELHDFINEIKQQNTVRIIYNRCKPYFHHEFALSKLQKEGYKLALCSNSIRATVELMMEQSALNKYLEFSLSNEDIVNAKPHPEIYIKAIDKLGLRPENCLVVEDNENGIASGKASGAYVFEVDSTEDVTYSNITSYIKYLEGSNA